jgi:single-strand DNA-binding protein
MKQEQVEFHNIVLWGKLAEIAGQYVSKWSKLFIEWRLQTRSWEAQDGTKRYRTEIVGENMIMLDNKSDNSNWEFSNSGSSTNDTPAVKRTTPKQEEEISVEDIPF